MEDTEKKQMCNTIANRWNDGLSVRATYDSERRKNYNLWKCIFENSYYHGRSKIVVPAGFNAIEIITSRIHDANFGHIPYINLTGKGKDALKVERLQKIMDEQLNEEIQFPAKFLQNERFCAIEGTSVTKTYWKRDFRKARRLKEVKKTNKLFGIIEQETGETEIKPVDYRETVYDNADVKWIDLDFLSIDPGADAFADPEWVIESRIVNPDFVKGNMRSATNPNGMYESIDIDKLGEQNLTNVNSYLTSSNSRVQFQKTGLLLREYWGLWDKYRNGVRVACLIVTLNDQEILYYDENPFFHGTSPYDITQWIPDKNTIYGYGMMDAIRSINYELNDAHNQGQDNRTMMLNPMALILRAAGIKPEDLKVRPMGFIRTSVMNGMSYLQPPDFTNSAYNTIQYLNGLIQETTGATKYTYGSDSADLNKTATGIVSIIREANKRIRHTASVQFEKKQIEQIVKKIKSLDEQYMEDGRYSKYLGENITKKDLIGEYTFKAIGTSQMGLQEIRQGQLVQLLGYMTKYPNAQVTFGKLMMKLWEGWGNDDAEEVFKELLQPQDMAINTPAAGGTPPTNTTGGVMGNVGTDVANNTPELAGGVQPGEAM